MARRRRSAAAVAVVATVTTAGFALTLVPGTSRVAAAAGLTPYDDCAQLLQTYRAELVRTATAFGRTTEVADLAGASAGKTASAPSKAVGTSGTGTNVQEAGVDEPDSTKLAGDVLLVAAGSTVQLVEPGPRPRVLSVVQLGKDAYGAQLLVDGTRALALTQDYAHSGSLHKAAPRYYPGYSRTVATLIDISEATAPRVLETTSTDGHLVSARLSDGRVRLVTSSQPRLPHGTSPRDHSRPEQRRALLANRTTARHVTLEQVLPHTERRTGAGVLLHRGPAVACDAVSYPRGATGTSTLTVTSLDLTGTLAPTGSVAVNADGDLAYMSATSLYVATSRWGTTAPATDAPAATAEVTTQLHVFALEGPTATYRATGSLPGYLLNSYSLSEHEGHLRAATTRQPPWQAPGRLRSRTSASLAVLRDDGKGALVETGRVDGLGKGEQIYAVRFLGELATVVTFRQTDPLYTLDLADPTAPKVLGQLKIPGFSNYLHPIGDGILVGVGQDADGQGRVTGLQLATFDLTDLTAPKRTRTLGLGRGYSEAAHDPHAFSYSPELRLVTLPMSDEQGRSYLLGVRATAGELVEVGRLAGPTASYVTRAVVVGGLLMAISDTGVTAADVRDLTATGSLRFRL